MTTYLHTGASIANYKAVQIIPGPNADDTALVVIALGPYQLSFVGWDAEAIATEWNISSNPFFQQITASVNDTTLILTSNILGQDFEVTVSINGDIGSRVSATQVLTLRASGGTFTLSDGTVTSGAITYSATPVTLRANIQAAIDAMSGYSSGDVVITGNGPFLLEFDSGRFAGLAVALWTATSSLTGGTALATVTTSQQGNAGTNEIITISFPADGTHTEALDEIQEIDVGSATSGSFTLTVPTIGTTSSLPFTAGRTAVKTALENVVGLGNVIVTGGPLTIESVGTFNGIQSISIVGYPDGGTLTLSFDGQVTGNITYNASTGTVQTALQALSTIGSGNILCTGGPFPETIIATFAGSMLGKAQNLITGDGTNLTQTTPLDITVTTIQSAVVGTNAKTTLKFQNAPGSLTGVTCRIFSTFQGRQAISEWFDISSNAAQIKAYIEASLGANSLFTVGSGNTIVTGDLATSFGGAGLTIEYTSGLKSMDIGTHTQTSSSATTLVASGVITGIAGTDEVQRLTINSTPVSPSCFISFNGILSDEIFFNASTIGSVVNAINNSLNSLNSETLNLFAVVDNTGSNGLGAWNNTGHSVDIRFYGRALQVTNVSLLAVTANPYGTFTVDVEAEESSTFAHYPLVVQFTGTRAGTNIGQMTTSGVATVTTTQDGGTQTVENISGGTWSLSVTNPATNTTYNIPNIPYDVSSAALDTLIEAVCGAGTVTVTGGPAPSTPLVIQFTGALEKAALTETLISSLTGNFGTSASLTTIREAISPPEVDNCWDMTITPGEGTLAVSDDDPLVSRGYLVITITEPESINPASIIDNNIYVPLYNINPARIETAINEAYGKDVVRVTRIVHSLEHAEIPAHTEFSSVSTAATPLHFWYYRDVFRLVFVNDFQAANSITDVAVAIAQISDINPAPASPALWMVPVTPLTSADVLDLYNESHRVYLGFTNYLTNENADQYHEFSCVRNTNSISNKLSYRVKLLTQFATYGEGSSALRRAGVARQITDNTVIFSWVKQTPADPSQYPAGHVVICSTPALNWDSSADAIEAALSALVTGFMDSVTVTGTLYNSWLSESAIDEPFPEDTYNDLRITLEGNLANLPLTELGYTLVATISPASASPDLRNPLIWIEPYSVPLPGGLNQRQRFSLASAEDVTALSMALDTFTISGLTPATTAAQLQALIAAAIGSVPSGGTAVEGWGVPLPEKWRNPVTVYGTTLALPVELEFSGFGYQYTNHSVVLGVTGATSVITFVETQAGVNPVGEVQNLVISGDPHGGTYTIDGGAVIAYNANAAAIQADLGSAPPTVTGTYPAFTLTWPSASGNVAQLATTSALNNSFVTVSDDDDDAQAGGLGASATVSDLTPGTGPLYLDNAQNYSPAAVFGSDDTLVIDDTVSAINFGLDMSSYFTVIDLGVAEPTGVGTIFQHSRNRIIFQDDQKVYLTGTGTPPAGLTFGLAYYIVNSTNSYTFGLSATPSGAAIVVTTVGTGTFRLTLRDVTLTIYSRYTGNSIGLPNNNSATSLPEYLAKYLVLPGVNADIGLGDGNGLSLFRLDSDDQPSTILIQQSGQSSTANIPAILLLCNNEDTNITILDGEVGIAVYSQEESLLHDLIVSGGGITIHNTTIEGTLTTSNGVTPVIQSGCTIAGLVTIE